MIRVWTPADRADDPERFRLRGLVEHISSGDRAAFRGAGELLAFCEARLDGRPQPDRTQSKEN